jgi:hypothetical protein
MGMREGYSTLIYIRIGLKRLASPAIVFFALPWLMVLLTLGTVLQKDIGIYTAQHMFFSSWILWAGPIPLPGGYLTIGLLTLSLLAKFLLYSPWSRARMGTILTHLGILVLLLGGIITAFSQKEGFLILGEGAQSNIVSDYHDRVLTIEKNNQPLGTIDFDDLRTGENISGVELPFGVTIESACKNCRPAPIKEAVDRKGLAAQMRLTEIAPEKENEANMSGATIIISGTKDNQDGTYITMEEVLEYPTIKAYEDEYRLYMTRKPAYLPFSIQLVNFEKSMHPGTTMARSYSSQIVIKDGDAEWPYHIRMNEPLRYKGYTFYQSSFSERPEGEYSILSVVENKGRVFPYLASAIIFLGLLAHVLLRLQARKGMSS